MLVWRYVAGGFLIVSGLAVLLFGKDEYLGYLEQHYFPAFLVFLVLLVAGAYLCGSVLFPPPKQ